MKIEDYVYKMPYIRIVKKEKEDNGDYYYGKILELDGCQSTGDTIDELLDSLDEAMEGYIEVKLENNLPIPEPSMDNPLEDKFIKFYNNRFIKFIE